MTVNATRCQAQDPSVCRFHKPGATEAAFIAWKAAETKLEEKSRILTKTDTPQAAQDYLDAKVESDEAEDEYYATPDGLISLYLQLEENPIENDIAAHRIKMKIELSKHKVLEQERLNLIDEADGGSLIPDVDSKYSEPIMTAGGDALWPQATGSNYDSSLRGTQLKAAINKEIKTAQKLGYLPKHINFNVRSRSKNITCTIIGASERQIYQDPSEPRFNNRTEKASELLNRVKGIVSSFNNWQYDEIEGRRNYSHFWDDVRFEDSWDKDRRLARAAKATQKD